MAPLVEPKKCHEDCITFPSLAFKNNSKKGSCFSGFFCFFVKKNLFNILSHITSELGSHLNCS